MEFPLNYLLLAFVIGFAGGSSPRRWLRRLTIVIGATLPLQFWAVAEINDIIAIGHGFNPTIGPASFAFSFGLFIAACATPVWPLVDIAGGRFRRHLARDA